MYRVYDLEMSRTSTCKNLTALVGRAIAGDSLGYPDEKERLLESMETKSSQVFLYFCIVSCFKMSTSLITGAIRATQTFCETVPIPLHFKLLPTFCC